MTTPFKTYAEAEEYLNLFTDYEKMVKGTQYPEDLFDLRRILDLLDKVDNPHHNLPGIHIAGTKGKGSTAIFAEAILQAHGIKTGLFTSPHFIDKEERIRVAGERIKKEDFLNCMNILGPALMVLKETPLPPTFFDIMTTVCLLHFRSQQVEAAILEVGLGGRLDSTNVFLPDVSVITRLGLDHTEKLGDTLDLIAAEKAGIIKPSRPVIAQPQEPEARPVLEKKCRETGSPLSWVGRQILIKERKTEKAPSFTVQTPNQQYTDLRLSVLGKHQRLNAATALSAAELFLQKRTGRLPGQEQVKGALLKTHLPGRIEVLDTTPLLVADGAHNSVAMAVVIQTIKEELSYKDLHLLFACSSDKDVRAMIAQLAPLAHRWTLTTFNFPRIEDPEKIRAILKEINPSADVQISQSPAEALEEAYRRSGPDDCILCTGSFYLIGELFKLRR